MKFTAALVLLAALSIGTLVRDEDLAQHAAELTGGNPAAGREAIERYGCGSCHTIPGIYGADGLVGPPLNHMANRSYIAGVMANSPEHMIRWILDPPAVDPRTAMPDLKLSEEEARDIAAYLYTLQ